MAKKVEKGINDFKSWCIRNNHQDWLFEWDYEKNGDLKPENIGFGSEKKIWWRGKCNHEWLLTPNSRTQRNSGCPYCSGRKVLSGYNDLETKYPEISKEWNYEKNGDLKPSEIAPFSNRRVWWKCKRGHEWEAVVGSRTSRDYGCPFCTGKRVIKGETDLQSLYPEVVKEWHPTKNGDLKPYELASKSNIRVWWKCNKCGHEWNSTIVNRTNLNRGCPLCGKIKMGQSRHVTLLQKNGSLYDNFPEIASEWHPSKNGFLLPTNIAAGSTQKVWWLGKCGHEYQASVGNRTNRKSGCPYCSGSKVIRGETDLQTKNPEVAMDWNYEKNGNLLPNEIAVSSNVKVWWKCKKCGYEWKTTVGNRTGLGRGCPECSKLIQAVTYRENRITKVGSLADTNPELAKEWHPTKNGDLKPCDVSAGCSEKVWWLFPYDEPSTGKHYEFEWEASIASRNAGAGCPFLVGKCRTGFNDVATTNPEVLKYWNYSKNTIRPESITKGGHEKVWWICDFGHSYKSAISRQCKKISCPICNKEKQTSFPEQAIFYYVRQIFPDAINGDRTALDGLELDIFIPSQKFGIEYDGSAWHKNAEKDSRKEIKCIQKGIKLIRVREEDCQTYESDSYRVYHYKYGDWKSLDKIIFEICRLFSGEMIDICIDRDTKDIEAMYYADKKNNSAAVTNPELISLWHPSKNGRLTLFQYNRGSEKVAWWIDSFGHEYKCRINSMTRGGEHCPYCSNRKLLTGFNDLQTRFPNVAEEWDYEKNEGIKPTDVRFNRGKYWFKCNECGNEWQAYLENRTRAINPTGCPICGNRRVINQKMLNNTLEKRFPNVANEWNYEKNGNLKPSDVNSNSKLRVWWKCSEGHEWETSILHRTHRESGCPFCISLKRSRAVKNIDTGVIYPSGTIAAKSVGLSGSGGIARCCQGKQDTAGGYHWNYVK